MCAIFLSSLQPLSREWLHFGAIFVPAAIFIAREEILPQKGGVCIPEVDFGAGSPPLEICGGGGSTCLHKGFPAMTSVITENRQKAETCVQELLRALFPAPHGAENILGFFRDLPGGANRWSRKQSAQRKAILVTEGVELCEELCWDRSPKFTCAPHLTQRLPH